MAILVAIVYAYTYTPLMKQPHAAQTAQLLQQIARIQHMEPGKLCVLRQGPNGAYYNLQWREQGKALSRYVPADQVEALAQHTANYQTFQSLVDQYAQLIIERTRAERGAGFKKKTSVPKSSSPKSRKSNS
jgi:hypothetical protein